MELSDTLKCIGTDEAEKKLKEKMDGGIGMGEMVQTEQLTTTAAFVEGGIQDAGDDACSICLEAFSDSDPAVVTNCMHEFHLQCVLEWCQRSSQCPMCWQAISMKDPLSQELLEAVEQERNMQENLAHTTTVFQHPLLGDFEMYQSAQMMLKLRNVFYSSLQQRSVSPTIILGEKVAAEDRQRMAIHKCKYFQPKPPLVTQCLQIHGKKGIMNILLL